MKLLNLVRALAISGAFLTSGSAIVLADEDCCAGTPACETMKKHKAGVKTKKTEVQKVSSEKTVESKVDEKTDSISPEKPSKGI